MNSIRETTIERTIRENTPDFVVGTSHFVEKYHSFKWQCPVHFADGSIDYLGIIVYHDNDIQNGTYSSIGTIKSQGEIFNRSGTGGNVTGDHVHLETGKGEVLLSDYKYHFLDNTRCKRIKPDEALFVNNTYVTPKADYNWLQYTGGSPSAFFEKTKFPWVLFSRKLIKKRKIY